MRFSREQFFRVGLIAFLFALPFGTKKFLGSFAAPFTNFYTSEYTAVFLFGADLLFLALLALACAAYRSDRTSGVNKVYGSDVIPLAAFFLLSFISIFFSAYPAFSWYSLLRLLIAAGAGMLVAWGFWRGTITMRHAAGALGASAVFQAIVALLQFFFQRSVGLWWLGETAALGPATPGIAGIVAEGGVPYLRAYGTLPHANILAGFLVLGLVALGYLFVTGERARHRAGAAAGLTLALAGLLVTFSRSGWIVAAAALAFFFALTFSRREYRRRAAALLLIVALALVLLVGALRFAVVPRADLSADEAPVRDRWAYNELGLALVAARPEGVGIGGQLFYSYDRGMFREFGLAARGQWQPIHNLYLLMAAEIGVLGLIAFLVFLWRIGVSGLLKTPRLEFRVSAIMLFALLLFGLFDHFLWDLHGGRLMLWAVLGMMWGVRPRRSMDRMSPSEGGDAGSIPAEGTTI